jgi:hypothetical protein
LAILVLVLSALVATTSDSIAAPPPPTLAVTSPTDGVTVKGTTSVVAQATAGTADTINSVAFYDGVNLIGSFACQSQATCTATVNWPATGLSGLHSLTARANSASGQQTTSAAVAVSVVTPRPTVAITAPAPGPVKGNVVVSASAATDPALDDYPTSITISDGAVFVGTIDCQAQKTCAGSVNWKATGATGAHTLTAKVNTHRSDSGISVPVVVNVSTPPPRVKITKPSSGARFFGRTMIVTVAGATDSALEDYPTSIDVLDGTSFIGSVSCQRQTTCGGSVHWSTKGLKGRHTLTAVIHTNRSATATSTRVVVGRPLRVKAKPRCTLSAHTARLGRRVRGTCIVPGAARGTSVAVKYRTARGSYVTVVRVKTGPEGGFHFSVKGSKRGATYPLVVVVAANGRYLKTTTSVGTLHIV